MYVSGEVRRSNAHFFFSSRRRHTRFDCDWSSDVCSSDLGERCAWVWPVMLLSTSQLRRELIAGGVFLAVGRGMIQASDLLMRSEERRVGKECRSRWSPYH